MTPHAVRQSLVDAVRLDLIGPGVDDDGLADELLDDNPGRYYLTGFLVPSLLREEDRSDVDADDDIGAAGGAGADDDEPQERGPAQKVWFPSSLGVSVLVPRDTKVLQVRASWGAYRPLPPSDDDVELDSRGRKKKKRRGVPWQRTPHVHDVEVRLDGEPRPLDIADTGMQVIVSVRPFSATDGIGTELDGVLAVSLFLVNHQRPSGDAERDASTAFQAALQVRCADGFVPRPDLRTRSLDEDERIADLQYRDAVEFAVGHNVSTCAICVPRAQGAPTCHEVHTTWVPSHEVERTENGEIDDATLDLTMEGLASAPDAAAVRAKLEALPRAYAAWIEAQRSGANGLSGQRREVALELVNEAEQVRSRIVDGLALLDEPVVLKAFLLAQKAMAMQARQRRSIEDATKKPADHAPPRWRLFQIAFLLINMRGQFDPTHASRGSVDLIFFPTGGGKTEAYLLLAAFTMLLRRLRNPGLGSAGVSVLMRYTLRLLTLDQLSRAASLICALDLLRTSTLDDGGRPVLGPWPFEIGLWVGRAATPNRMGRKGDKDEWSARTRVMKFKADPVGEDAPIPLRDCPWCGSRLSAGGFSLEPNADTPRRLRIVCVEGRPRGCLFMRDRALPIVAVDDSIYRRLPAMLIATVDKFAALPWTGETGVLFGRVHRFDEEGFYGPMEPAEGRPLPGAQQAGPRGPFPLLPPDLIIQDELHLISGPLGTMVGLYETAIDELCTRDVDGKRVGPKIVASTATVRRARDQIRALFRRRVVQVFPPPGRDLSDSFFARTIPVTSKAGRLYIGLSAPGRNAKVLLLRTYLALLGATQRAWTDIEASGGGAHGNAADAYMTLLGYFGSLKELGGARRIVEDEVAARLPAYGARRRLGEARGLFSGRTIAADVPELTSRESTDRVADTKRRLALGHDDKEHVDVALATNMISVGLDIARLGLMVVLGQPKSSAEYIQASSRVGRHPERPGLVVTLYNAWRPRDRSHFERFAAYHASFYRAVEATSVTPFSPRAIDRGLAAVVVALARQGFTPMNRPGAALDADTHSATLAFIKDVVGDRAADIVNPNEASVTREAMRAKVGDLIDVWAKLANEYRGKGTGLQYQSEEGAQQALLHVPLDPALAQLDRRHRRFRAQRSLRDVENSVNLWVKRLQDDSGLGVDSEGEG
jgi:hypothetical protein